MTRWLLPLLLLLSGCGGRATTDAVDEAQAQVAAEVSEQQRDAVQAVVPAVLAVQDAVAGALEALPLAKPPREEVHPDALALVVGFEIISPSYYQRALQGVICPKGASGPTWGIGYDGGHQSASTILRDWAGHPDVERMATAAGVIGDANCRAWRGRHLDIRVPLPVAQRVFAETMVPTWLRATRRAYPGIDAMSPWAEGGIFSNTFNRGTSFLGSRAAEKRVVRDTCVPNRDAPCAAQQVRLSCRIWQGTAVEAGLCRRRNAEGDLIETTT